MRLTLDDALVREYLKKCYELASLSPDPSNQNGAILVARYNQKFEGWNRWAPGFSPTPEQAADRDWKLAHIEHAERSALFGAMVDGMPTRGGTLFCPWAACADCARAISLAGIADLFVHKARMDTTPERWKASVEQGLDIIRRGGTKIHVYEGEVGGVPIRANGELWQG